MISQQEILDAYEAAAAHARCVARGRLDDDACRSEAGLAVTLALRRFDRERGATFTTYTKKRVRGLVLNLVKKERRYETRSEAFWAAVLAAPAPVFDEPDKYECLAAGISIRQLRDRFNLTFHEARQLHRRSRHARQKIA